MDFEGFMLLTEKRVAEFQEWQRKSPDMSLDELLESYFQWKDLLLESHEKYWFKPASDASKDVSTFTANMMYFMFMVNFAWNVLESYTAKLQEEYNALKKSKPAKRTKKQKTLRR